AALLYYSTQVFQQHNVSVVQGWYLTSFIPVEAVVLIAGMQGWFGTAWKLGAAIMALCLLALWIYTSVFVAMPYYSGFTHHGPSGQVTAYHPALHEFPIMWTRLLRLYPGVPTILPWLALTSFAAFGAHSIYRIIRSDARIIRKHDGI